MNFKIIKELQNLIENEVISVEIADKIEAYYQSKSPQKGNKLLTIFAILGSLLVGLGIILILAHNWDDFPKVLKTILAFIPLVIGQIIVGFTLLKKKSKTWLESSGVFLFFAIGSSISLISQIYNIPGSLHTFLLSWVFLCIPLIYILKSKAILLLTLIFSTIYACDLGYSFSGIRKIPWMYLVIISLVLPSYINQVLHYKARNITAILNWLFPLSFIITLGAFINTNNYQLTVFIYTFLYGLLYNIGKLSAFEKIRLSKNGFTIIGSLGIVFTMFLASFESFWLDHFDITKLGIKEIVISLLLIIVSLAIAYKNTLFSKINFFKNIYQFTSLLVILVYWIQFIDNTIAFGLLNLLIFMLGIVNLKRGVNTLNFTLLNYGLLIISILIITRFLDTNLSFVVRGMLFILVGLSFFIFNYILVKKIKN